MAAKQITSENQRDLETRVDPEKQARSRKCLMCGTDFKSAWAGERICRKCKSTSKWRHG